MRIHSFNLTDPYASSHLIQLAGMMTKIVNASTGQVVSRSGVSAEMLDWLKQKYHIQLSIKKMLLMK